MNGSDAAVFLSSSPHTPLSNRDSTNFQQPFSDHLLTSPSTSCGQDTSGMSKECPVTRVKTLVEKLEGREFSP